MKTVLIDNGHGVSTPGKRSPDGILLEYKWAREVARLTADLLKAKGIPVQLLVPEDADIPLRERCNRANAICDRVGAKNALLVSIHVNAAGNGLVWMNASGWEAYTTPGFTQADRLATCLYEAARKKLGSIGFPIRCDHSDGDPDKEAKFTILTGTKCPAVLTENLFMDNLSDCGWLLSEDGKLTIARLHVEGIMTYLGKTN